MTFSATVTVSTLAIVWLSIAAGTTLGQSHAIPSWLTFNCTNRTPGLYADRVRGCHVFNFCSHSGKIFDSLACPGNTLFNQALQDCVDPAVTPTPCPTIFDVPANVDVPPRPDCTNNNKADQLTQQE